MQNIFQEFDSLRSDIANLRTDDDAMRERLEAIEALEREREERERNKPWWKKLLG